MNDGSAANSTMAAARRRFVSGLDRKLGDLQGLVGRIEEGDEGKRARDDLRRRLNALYASAKVFKVDGLTQALAGALAQIETLEEDSATLPELRAAIEALMAQHGGAARLPVEPPAESVPAEAASASLPAEAKVDEAAVAGFLETLEQRSAQALGELRGRLAEQSIGAAQRRAAMGLLEDAFSRLGAALADEAPPPEAQLRRLPPSLTGARPRRAELRGLRLGWIGLADDYANARADLVSAGVELVDIPSGQLTRKQWTQVVGERLDVLVAGFARGADTLFADWHRWRELPLCGASPALFVVPSETYADRMQELGVPTAQVAVVRDDKGAESLRGLLEQRLGALAQLEQGLQGAGPVFGRIAGFSLAQLLPRVAAKRPDTKLVVRASHSMFEVQLREGELRSISRTSIDGHFTSGQAALASLLCVRQGVYQVTQAQGAAGLKLPDGGVPNAVIVGASTWLAEALATLVLGPESTQPRLAVDEEAARTLLRFSPEPYRTELRTALRACEEGVAAPGLMLGLAADIVRHGVVRHATPSSEPPAATSSAQLAEPSEAPSEAPSAAPSEARSAEAVPVAAAEAARSATPPEPASQPAAEASVPAVDDATPDAAGDTPLPPVPESRLGVTLSIVFLLALGLGFVVYWFTRSAPEPATQPTEPPPAAVPEAAPPAADPVDLSAFRPGSLRPLELLPEALRELPLEVDACRLVVDAVPAGAPVPKLRIGDRELGMPPLHADLPAGRIQLTWVYGEAQVHRFAQLRAGQAYVIESHPAPTTDVMR